MLIRSTGLGRSEMEGRFETVEKKADYLIFGIHTTAPVKWHIRVAMTFPDLFGALFLVLTSRQGWGFIMSQLFKSRKKVVRPEDF